MFSTYTHKKTICFLMNKIQGIPRESLEDPGSSRGPAGKPLGPPGAPLGTYGNGRPMDNKNNHISSNTALEAFDCVSDSFRCIASFLWERTPLDRFVM